MSDANATLCLRNVSKRFGRTEIIRDVSLDVRAGERHAIIGPNGAGKSTLFNLISGRFAPSAGSITFEGRSLERLAPFQIARRGLARSFQITNVFPKLSVFENVRCAVIRERGYGLSIVRSLGRLGEVTERCDTLLEEIGLASRRDWPAELLSYAELRALELGITIAGDARMLLLDEPMAGMSHSETTNALSLIRRISTGRTLMLVEHDMAVVFDLADRISVLVYGQILATGTPAEIRANAAVQEAYLGGASEAEVAA